MKKLLLYTFIVFINRVSLCQTYIEKTYGGTQSDKSLSTAKTLDSGYVFCGSTESFGNGMSDLYVVCTDSIGDTIWTNSYGSAENEFGMSIKALENGNFIACGTATVSGSTDIYVVMISKFGLPVWVKTFGGAGRQNGYDVLPTSDGNFLVIGDTPGQSTDIKIIKIDAGGNEIWAKELGGSGIDVAQKIIPLLDGGFLLCGYTTSSGAGGSDMFIIKLDSSGTSQWSKTYGGGQSDVCFDALQMADSSYLLCGNTNSFGNGQSDGFIIKISSTGDSLWSKTYGKSESDGFYSIQFLEDDTLNGFILAGFTYSFGYGSSDMYLVRIDSAGEELWFQTFGGSGLEEAHTVLPLGREWFALAGVSETFGSGMADVFFVRASEPIPIGMKETIIPVENKYTSVVTRGGFLKIFNSDFNNSPYTIYNMTGCKIESGNLIEGAMHISNFISPGLYLINFMDFSKRRIIKKIVVL